MSEELENTVRIIRKAKVATDDRGRSVWVDPVETAKLELVSTQMLEALIDADEEAASGEDGLLAHDPEKDAFEIVSDDDLKAALSAASDTLAAPTHSADVVYEFDDQEADLDEMSLVSTQMLKAILDPNAEPEQEPDTDTDFSDPGGGFDPYNSS